MQKEKKYKNTCRILIYQVRVLEAYPIKSFYLFFFINVQLASYKFAILNACGKNMEHISIWDTFFIGVQNYSQSIGIP